ncbi:jmjC domain-containing protein 8 isoform X2 [Oryzias latipes]|uniref:Jumonji domain containing 8 n=1 Tax=Oryzias latipes TaxID=8090 RepID=A0A3B3HX12_ORYLA|nr:jmjC domain-containing protein 8 isoform X2 [Oryzias latipes]
METRTAAGVRFWVLLGLVSRFAGLKDDGGGWYGESDFRLEDEGPCNLDVLDASELSHQQFLDRYAFSRPLVLRGLTDNTRFRLLCSRSSLLRDYGSRRVKLSTANTHSYRKVEVPFQEYVDVHLRPQSADALGSDTLYFFGDNNFTEWQSLFQQYEPPPYVLPHTSGAYSFGIAALVPLPAGKPASLPPKPHHPVLADGDLPPPAGGRGSAGVHHPAWRGAVLPRPMVARHPQPGHQRLHLHLPRLSSAPSDAAD